MRRKTNAAALLWGSVPAVLMAISSAALAQSTAALPEAAALDEIVVTAQRRTEKLEDVPMSISVVTADTLAKAGVSTFQNLGSIVAGAQINFNGAYTQPSLRGVTTLINGNAVENNVATYVDGFYEPSSLIINNDLPNISNIEVLKGPQGTLYGRNATGGAILINTAAPSSTYTEKAEITYARFNDRRASGYISGPITDRILFAIAGYYREDDGYIRFSSPTTIGQVAGDAAPIKQSAARAKLAIDISDNLKATVGFNYAHVDDARTLLFSPFQYVPATYPKPPLRPTEFGTVAYNYATSAPTTIQQGTVKLDYETPIGILTSHTSETYDTNVLHTDPDGTYADLSSGIFDFEEHTFQQALDYDIKAIPNTDLLVGGLYYKDKLEQGPDAQSIFGANRTLLLTNYSTIRTEAWALYADATYQITNKLSLDAGGRYSHETKDADFASFSGPTFKPGTALSRSAAFPKFTPRASILYKIRPGTNIYASYTQGFRSGQFNSSPPAIPSQWKAVSPEKIDAFEVGLKSAAKAFRFNIAGFYYDYTNLQVTGAIRSPQCPPLPTTCGLILSIYQSAPKAEIYGSDAEISATPVEALNVRAGISWLHARYIDFPGAIGTGLNATTGVNATNQVQDWSGQQMARAPASSGYAGIDYDIPIGVGSLLVAGNVNYTTGYVINNLSLYGPLAGALAAQQRYRQGGYALLNASATWNDPSNHFYITVFGQNLTNKAYKLTYTGNANGDYGTPAEPITYGVKLGTRF